MSSVIQERPADGYVARTVEQTLDRLYRAARPDVVFGQPIERGDTTIIPCLEVSLGMGMGGGSGSNPAADQVDRRTGEGMGAGGGATGRPVAVIVMSRDNVRVQPIVDMTKVGLAALTTAGFALFWLARLTQTTRSTPARPRTIAGRGPSLAKWVSGLRR